MEMNYVVDLMPSSLKNLETEIISCVKNNQDRVILLCIKCLTFCRFAPTLDASLSIRYHIALAHAYVQFKGLAYAAQAEEHLKQAQKLSQNISVVPFVSYSGQESTSQAQTSSYYTEDLPESLTILLLYYTFARVKLHLLRFGEAAKYALFAQLLLEDLPSGDRSERSQSCLSGNGKDVFAHVDLSTVDSILLRPQAGFYPELRKIGLDLLQIVGKCSMARQKYSDAKRNFCQAMELCTGDTEENRKEIISLNHSLAKVAEHLIGTENEENPVDYYEAAYQMASNVVADNDSEENRRLLILCAHRLSKAYVQQGTNVSIDRAESLLTKVLEWADEYDGPGSDDPTSSRHAESLIQASMEAAMMEQVTVSNASPEYIGMMCLLRSSLIKLLLLQRRMEDAIKLIKQNLFVQQMVFGLYSKQAVTTEKMLLSALLTQGETKQARKHANMCLEMEVFTFGPKSKQAEQTREILDTLNGLQC